MTLVLTRLQLITTNLTVLRREPQSEADTDKHCGGVLRECVAVSVMRARAVDDLQREILPHDTVCIDSKLTRRSRRDPRKYQESRDWTGTEGVGDGGDFR